MFRKLTWALRLLRSRTYVLLTDKAAVVNVPANDPENFENVMLLAAQTASLQNFRFRLEDLIREHEEAIQLLTHREKQGRTQRKPRVPRATKAKK